MGSFLEPIGPGASAGGDFSADGVLLVRRASGNFDFFRGFFTFLVRFLPVFVPNFALFPSMSCTCLYVHNFRRTHVSRFGRENLAFDKETAEETRNALSGRGLTAEPCFQRRDRRARRERRRLGKGKRQTTITKARPPFGCAQGRPPLRPEGVQRQRGSRGDTRRRPLATPQPLGHSGTQEPMHWPSNTVSLGARSFTGRKPLTRVRGKLCT